MLQGFLFVGNRIWLKPKETYLQYRIELTSKTDWLEKTKLGRFRRSLVQPPELMHSLRIFQSFYPSCSIQYPSRESLVQPCHVPTHEARSRVDCGAPWLSYASRLHLLKVITQKVLIKWGSLKSGRSSLLRDLQVSITSWLKGIQGRSNT